jgi:hypothetical protein
MTAKRWLGGAGAIFQRELRASPCCHRELQSGNACHWASSAG